MRILYNFVDNDVNIKTISEIAEVGLNEDNSLYLAGSGSISDVVSIESVASYQYDEFLRKLLRDGYLDLTSENLHFMYNDIANNEDEEI